MGIFCSQIRGEEGEQCVQGNESRAKSNTTVRENATVIRRQAHENNAAARYSMSLIYSVSSRFVSDRSLARRERHIERTNTGEERGQFVWLIIPKQHVKT